MSKQELHDLLLTLEKEREQFDIVDQEQRQRLEAIVESLEQQQLYPDAFDQYSTLKTQLEDAILEYEHLHPSIASLLNNIARVLNSFKA